MKGMEPFLSFVDKYRTVEMALKEHALKPFVADDPTMNAYDFRPIAGKRFRVIRGLNEIGFYMPLHMDKGIFEHNSVLQLSEIVNANTNVTSHLVAMYAVYARLKDGRLSRWKLLKEGNMPLRNRWALSSRRRGDMIL